MKNTFFRLLSVLLVLGLLLSLSAAALAEGYEQDQFFQAGTEGESVYTVQVSATTLLSGAERLRAKMLEAGFDCFIYLKFDLYHVMCGKFLSEAAAQTYRSAIVGSTDRSGAYVTSVTLPQGERDAFESVYTAEGGVITKEAAGKMPRRALVNLALEANTFAGDQFYMADSSQFYVYTVQVSAHLGRESAEADRDSMLAKGYDSFVYQDDTMFYVMCGKFPSIYEALCYGESIHTDSMRYSAYVTNIWLPEAAVTEFTKRLAKYVMIPQDSRLMETYWEDPSGPYYRADGDDTVEVYSVQISEGSSFAMSEYNRDRIAEAGFPSFVYKLHMAYRTMSGMFTDKAEAEKYCQSLRSATGKSGAFVSTALIPAADVEAFQTWYTGQ